MKNLIPTSTFLLAIAIMISCKKSDTAPVQDPVPPCLMSSVYYLYGVGYQEFQANVSYSSDNRISTIQLIRLQGNVQWNYAFTYYKGRRPRVIADANGYSLEYTYDNSDRVLTRTAKFKGALRYYDSIIYNAQQISAVVSNVDVGVGFEIHKFCYTYNAGAKNPSVIVDSIKSLKKYSYYGQSEYTFSSDPMPEFNINEITDGVKLDYGFVNLTSQVIHKNPSHQTDYTATSVTIANTNSYPLKNTVTANYTSGDLINRYYEYTYTCK